MNRNQLFSWTTIMLVIMLFATTISCSKDDKEEEPDKGNPFIGNWLYVSEEDMVCYLLTFTEKGAFDYQSQEVGKKSSFGGAYTYTETTKVLQLTPTRITEEPITYHVKSVATTELIVADKTGKIMIFSKTFDSNLPSFDWKGKILELLFGNWLYTSEEAMECYLLSLHENGEFLYQSQEVNINNKMAGKYYYDTDKNAIILTSDESTKMYVVGDIDNNRISLIDERNRVLLFDKAESDQFVEHYNWKPWDYIFSTWDVDNSTFKMLLNGEPYMINFAGCNLSDICDSALRFGMKITENEQMCFKRWIKSITLFLSTEFVIEYIGGTKDIGKWGYASEDRNSIIIRFSEESMGNKFISNNTLITWDYGSENRCRLIFTTVGNDKDNGNWEVSFILLTHNNG